MSFLFTFNEGIVFKPKIFTLGNFIAWLKLRFTDTYYRQSKTRMGPFCCESLAIYHYKWLQKTIFLLSGLIVYQYNQLEMCQTFYPLARLHRAKIIQNFKIFWFGLVEKETSTVI